MVRGLLDQAMNLGLRRRLWRWAYNAEWQCEGMVEGLVSGLPFTLPLLLPGLLVLLGLIIASGLLEPPYGALPGETS